MAAPVILMGAANLIINSKGEMNILRTASNKKKIIDIILVVLFILLFMSNLIQVIFRMSGASLIWSEELARILFVWCTYLGMALVTRDKEHIIIDILDVSLRGKDKISSWVDSIHDSIHIVILLVLLILSFRYMITTIERNLVTAAMRLPYWVPVLSLTIGSLLSIIYIISQNVVKVVKFKD